MQHNDQWKISSPTNRIFTSSSRSNSDNTTTNVSGETSTYVNATSFAQLPMRSPSPFIKMERYKPKSPLIDAHRQQKFCPKSEVNNFHTSLPIETVMDEYAANEKSMTPLASPKVNFKENISTEENNDYVPWNWWSGYAFFLTCCIPSCILSVFGKKSGLIQQAWREKIALCSIILSLCIILGFFTFGMRFVLCPHERSTNTYSFLNTTTNSIELTWRSEITVYGKLYPYDIMSSFLKSHYNITLTRDFEGSDMSSLFDPDPSKTCGAYYDVISSNCSVRNPYTSEITASIQHPCIPIDDLTQFYTTDSYLEFNWSDLKLSLHRQQTGNNTTSIIESNQKHLLVLSDTVVDIRPYFSANQSIFGTHVDQLLYLTAGQDGTYIFSAWDDAKQAWPCITKRYSAGVISSDTMGCIAYEIINDFFLVVVVLLILARYSMAFVFHWWVSRQLTFPGGRSRGIFAWRSVAGGNQFPKKHRPSNSSSQDTLLENTRPEDNDSRHTILFVTCYSEGRDSIKGTLDSLVNTTYSDKHKFLFIVVDGIITGEGNDEPTSEICRNLLTLVDCSEDEEEPACEYNAIADGSKRLNRARVYTGYYGFIPTILVCKCGTEAEAAGSTHKLGNRGKRDSQMILMSFFQKVMFYDNFTQLDYEIFWKMKKLMKNDLSPDKFELVLMVDADTRVSSNSISNMVAAMNNDITLMGLCGETKVANKGESWVTAIQVFEYFISHHYAKAFESIFGGVTCLPGCFSMYRIKAPKNGGWIPILASPDIINEFNITTVNTLHAKNLLLLGEDRFLSTLMLRTFPKRQMIFVPQAKCHTVVPSTFSVLLSQRRRWINSTVHNLMELALVSDLCGIACLSMQFVVMVDLISSIVLPAAVLLLFMFLINMAFAQSPEYQTLFILLATLGFPALLILFTAKKLTYIGWMAVYIIALPIWNFILPIYSFWHFDDFTWGETRKLDGTNDKNRPAINDDTYSNLPSPTAKHKLWHAWEIERLKLKEKRLPKSKRAIFIKPKLTEQISTIRELESHLHTSSPSSLTALQNPNIYSNMPYNNSNQNYTDSFHHYHRSYPPYSLNVPIAYQNKERQPMQLNPNYISHPPLIMQPYHQMRPPQNAYQSNHPFN